MLRVQLQRLDEQTQRRHRNARLLDSLLSQIEGITPQRFDERCTRNGQYAYIFHYDKAAFAGVSTETFIKAMLAEGIPNQAAYPPVHKLDVFHNGEYRKRLNAEQAAGDHAFLRQPFPEHRSRCMGNVLDPADRPVGRRGRHARDRRRGAEDPAECEDAEGRLNRRLRLWSAAVPAALRHLRFTAP